MSRLLMTRTTFAIRAFFLTFFSFFTVALGVVFLAIPEIRETLEAFDLRDALPQAAYLALVQLYWAVCAWFCARLVLEALRYRTTSPCALLNDRSTVN